MTQTDPQDKQALRISLTAVAQQVGFVSEYEWSALESTLGQAVVNQMRTPVGPVEREICHDASQWGPPRLSVSVLTR